MVPQGILLCIALSYRIPALFGLIIISAGVFSICGAVYDWDWFIHSRKARFFVFLFGRDGARVFYGILGAVVILMGAAIGVGLMSMENKRDRFGFPPLRHRRPPMANVPEHFNRLLQQHERLIQQHEQMMVADPKTTAIIDFENLPPGLENFVVERLAELSRATNRSWMSRNGHTTVTVSPVADVQRLAKGIDLGKVTDIDESDRRITVRVDASKLPSPLPPEVTNPLAPDFYRRNLGDLTSWDSSRRKRAAERLCSVQPRELRPEISAALLQELARTEDIFALARIIEALPVWSTADEALPKLIVLLDHPQVINQVIQALGRFHDARAVEPLLLVVAGRRGDVTAALKEIGEPAEPVLLRHVEDANDEVRKQVIGALGDVGTRQSAAVLKRLCASNDLFIRAEADRAYARLRQRCGASL